MASPKIESTETRLTTKGLFPILNTLSKSRQDVWDKSYKLAQSKLAAQAPTSQKVSELKFPEDITQFSQGLPNGNKLVSGALPSQQAAFNSWGEHQKVWDSKEAQEAVANHPYRKELLERLNASRGVQAQAQPTLLQKGIDASGRALGTGASVLTSKALGGAGALGGVIGPILPELAAGVAKDKLTAKAIAPNYGDLVPLARVANAEKAYTDAHTAYSSLPQATSPQDRWRAYHKLTEAQKAYNSAHESYQSSLLTPHVKGKSLGDLIPDSTLPSDDPLRKEQNLSQQGLQESTQFSNPPGEALVGAGGNALSSYFSTLPGAVNASIAAPIAGALHGYLGSHEGEGFRGASKGLIENAPRMLPAALAALKGVSKAKTPIALLASSAANAANQVQNFRSMTPSQQEAYIQQNLLDESVRSSNRTGLGEVGDAATRGLGYLATGNLADAATYLGGKSAGKEALRSVASETAAKRFEDQKIDNAKKLFSQDPIIGRYAGYEGANDSAREFQLYRAQLAQAAKWDKEHGSTQAGIKLMDENSSFVDTMAKRLGNKLTPQQRSNLEDVVSTYGAGAMERLWRNAPLGLISQDLNKQPVAQPQ